MRKTVCSGVCLILLAHGGTARAEPNTPPEASLVAPKPSQGYFVALGLHGTAAMAFDQNRSTRSPTLGEGLSLRLGEALTDWLDLSLAFALAQTHGAAEDRFTYGRLGIHSQWYVWDEWF